MPQEARMAALSPEERKLFSDKNFVVLATTRADGTPRAVVLWVDVDGDEILVNGARSRAWVKNLRRDPHVALAIFDLQEPYRRVSLQGTVSEITDDGADEHYGRLAQKYRGYTPEEYKQRLETRPLTEHRTIVRIRPERVIARAVG
jgi:PPOX class probable F420-dependent enzyme